MRYNDVMFLIVVNYSVWNVFIVKKERSFLQLNFICVLIKYNCVYIGSFSVYLSLNIINIRVYIIKIVLYLGYYMVVWEYILLSGDGVIDNMR